MSKKNILESFYLRRRFSPQRINEKFFQAVKYCLESNQLSPKVSSVEQFKNYVTTVLIDGMHWELFGGDLWAPYDEVFDFLKKEFSDEIENIYYKTKKEGIKENIKIIWEMVNKNEVICDNCGWSWKLSEGGNDPFVCHKCGNNNSIQSKLPISFRRRLIVIDKIFKDKLKYFYGPQTCLYNSTEKPTNL